MSSTLRGELWVADAIVLLRSPSFSFVLDARLRVSRYVIHARHAWVAFARRKLAALYPRHHRQPGDSSTPRVVTPVVPRRRGTVPGKCKAVDFLFALRGGLGSTWLRFILRG